MLKKVITFFVIVLFSVFCSYGTDIKDSVVTISTSEDVHIADIQNKDTISGWNLVPIPFPAYSSDYGFIIGVFLPVLNYGSPSLYPNYIDQFELMFRYSTNKSGVVRFFYDSEHLIPKLRTTFDISYIVDRRFPFYGYNGYEVPYNDSRNSFFYSYSRQFLRATVDAQGTIWNALRWATGISYYYLNTESSNALLSPNQQEATLYDIYCATSIISSAEKGGGQHIYFRGGFFYDSRDFGRAPSKGMATELTVALSPDIIEAKGFSHGKLAFYHRQFFPLWGKKLVLAYKIAYQGTLFGNVPFYMQQNIHNIFQNKAYSDGVGGESSIRGILPQRVLGNGMFWANIETRFRFVDFRLFKQNIYLAVNPFFDFGMVVQKYKEEELLRAEMLTQMVSRPFDFLSGDSERLHKSLGLGFKCGINENLILTLEIGFALDNRDGNYGIYGGTNFSF